eukprot:Gb_37766 [translate_table: standard]
MPALTQCWGLRESWQGNRRGKKGSPAGTIPLPWSFGKRNPPCGRLLWRYTMSFFSRGSRRGAGRRGHQSRNVWEQGRRKRIRFSIHLDADSDEFHRFAQTGHLYLGPVPTPGQSIDTHLPPPPLQPHPSIQEMSLVPGVNPAVQNNGWNFNSNLPPIQNDGWGPIATWPMHRSPTPAMSTEIHAQSIPEENPVDLIDPEHPELESVEDKGKGKGEMEISKAQQPKEDSSSSSGHHATSVFLDMHPKITRA